MIMRFSILLPLWLLNNCIGVDSICNFPAQWSGTWYDSSRSATISIATDQITGWSVTAFVATSTVWACKFEDPTNNYYVFEGDQTTTQGGNILYTYICIKWTEVTANSYYYYRMSNINGNAANARVVTAPQITSGFAATVCNGSPTSPEFFTMVKDGQQAAVKQNCPEPFLGTFSYVYNDGSSTTCGTPEWDGCSDRQAMTFNLATCSTKIAYSTSGLVYCAASIVDSSDSSIYYVSVVNSDSSVDNSATYRFTCFAVKTSGSNVVASQKKEACESGQTPTAQPTGGATITLTASTTCPFTTTSATTTTTTTQSSASSSGDAGGSAVAVAAGGAIAAVVIIAVVIIVIILVIKYKKSPRKVNGSDHVVSENGTIPPKEDTNAQPNSARDAIDVEPPNTNRLSPIPNSTATADPPLPPINPANH